MKDQWIKPGISLMNMKIKIDIQTLLLCNKKIKKCLIKEIFVSLILVIIAVKHSPTDVEQKSIYQLKSNNCIMINS